MNAIAASVLEEAISALRQKHIDVYTFALYFDHESLAISVCADTAANSTVTVVSRPGEFHPQPLAEPYVTVSRHTAPIARPPARP